MKKYILLLLVSIFAFSCEKNSPSDALTEEDQTLKLSNYELIKDDLVTFQENQDSNRSSNQYICSELGSYTSQTYLTTGYYLNSFYAPSNAQKFSNLEDLFNYRFQTPNASGNNSASIYVNFEIEGANGGTYLDATDSNRVYNEFICQLDQQVTVPGNGARPEYHINFIIDYFLCCNGSTCCKPVLDASGTVYWD